MHYCRSKTYCSRPLERNACYSRFICEGHFISLKRDQVEIFYMFNHKRVNLNSISLSNQNWISPKDLHKYLFCEEIVKIGIQEEPL